MANPTYVASSFITGFNSSNTTSYSVTLPTNSAGQTMYYAIASDAVSQTFTTPSGWSVKKSNVDIPATSPTATAALFYKVSNGSEPATITQVVGTSERQVWALWTVDSDGGFDADGTDTTGNSATATVPAVTTTSDNCLIWSVVFTDGVSTPHGTISGYTKLGEVSQASAASLSVFYIAQGTHGTQASQTVSITTEQWLGITFAIKPANTSINIVATCTATTTTPSAQIDVVRAITATATTGTTTPTATLDVARAITATCAASTTTAGDLIVSRAITATFAGATTTPGVQLDVLRNILATFGGVTTTPAVQLDIARALAATFATVTTTSAITFTGDVAIVATFTTTTTTSAAALNVDRPLAATFTAATTTPEDAELLKIIGISSTFAVATTTPDVELNIGRALTGAFSVATTTADASMAVDRVLSASFVATTATPTAQLDILRALTATFATATSTPSVELQIIFIVVAGRVSVAWSAKKPFVSWSGSGPTINFKG